MLFTFFGNIILFYEHLRFSDILLISKIDDHAIEIFYYDILFHKMMSALEQGNTCLRLVITFKTFDCCVEFIRERRTFKFRLVQMFSCYQERTDSTITPRLLLACS